MLDENAQPPVYKLQDRMQGPVCKWRFSNEQYTASKADWKELVTLFPKDMLRTVTAMEVECALKTLANPAK
jgi:hypothetical protein